MLDRRNARSSRSELSSATNQKSDRWWMRPPMPNPKIIS
jgi:hypothetical protein